MLTVGIIVGVQRSEFRVLVRVRRSGSSLSLFLVTNPTRPTCPAHPASPIVQSFAVRIAIGADHAGFSLKEHLKQTLARLGHSIEDLGTTSEASVDYPPICFAVAREVAEGRADRGIVLGGSGQGEQIAANKIAGIRAALCNDLYTARLSREHNDANVLSMGGRVVAFALADAILELWLTTKFEGGRHQRRLDQISAQEKRCNT
jgi:ribose 5-phosphate isomerase B